MWVKGEHCFTLTVKNTNCKLKCLGITNSKTLKVPDYQQEIDLSETVINLLTPHVLIALNNYYYNSN